MKFKIFNLLVIMAMLAVMPMIYMGKLDPLALLDSASDLPDLDDLRVETPASLKDMVPDEKVQVYRWRDENGVMQYSNMPPAAIQAEQVEVDTSSNLMQAVKVKKSAQEKKVVAESIPSPYSPNDMKKAMQDARDVERLLQERHEQQQQTLDKL